MKKTFNTIIQFFELMVFVIKVILRTDFKNHLKYQNHNRELMILANGPSLNNVLQQLDLFSYDYSVVNDFFKSPYYSIIKPKYHVLADPLYFTEEEYLNTIIDVVKWEMILLVPYNAYKKNHILRNMSNRYIVVRPFHLIEYKGFEKLRNVLYKSGLAMPRSQNVVVASIYTAINMGYKTIKLYGVDHSWTESIRVNENNQVCQVDAHFYDTEKVKLAPWHKTSGEVYKMSEILRDLAQMFDSYDILRKYADYMKCKVINNTKGSFIDAFERS